MRTRIFGTAFFICSFALSLTVCFGQRTTLSRDWKFNTGDSSQWSSAKYNDAHWKNLKAGLWWAHAGYEYSGFAWYRKAIVIPSSLKPAVRKLGYLKLSLGQIQDADETYMNGKLIGKTGSFSPFEGRWGEPRSYFVKEEQIKWDAPNVIAVRVYGPHNNGGMHTGPYYMEPYKITFKDYVTIKGKASGTEGKDEPKQQQFAVSFRNRGDDRYSGVLMFQIKDTTGKILAEQKQEVVIGKGESAPVTFNYTIAGEGIYHFSSVFTEATSGGRLEKKLTISTIKNIVLPVSGQPSNVVQNKVIDVFVPARFEDQKVQGYLGDRLNINLVKRLLQVDEHELLAGYLDRPGKQNWVGEHIGKYLETASNMWRYTHHAALKAQMDRMLFVLLHTQLPDGYLGTYTPENYWTNWDVWSHKYNMVGLLAYYKATGYAPALEAATRIGDLLCKTFGDAPGQLDLITSGTHVGMASASVLDPIVDLYQITGNKKYLDFAHYIVRSYNEPDGPKIIKTLLETGKVNKVANGKAYEMLSNLVGVLKLYKVTGDPQLLNAAQTAWNDIVQNRLYITGTASSYELFRDDEVLPAGEEAHMGEGCVTTTWVQFNYQLFTLTGEAKFLDQLERSAYNHLPGAENPQTGCVSYYTSLQDKKPFSCGVTCCLSSVPRGISMIPLFNYGKRSGVPTILLHESELITDTANTNDGSAVPFTLQAFSNFMNEGKITYLVSPAKAARFSLAIRIPTWAENFTAVIDGKKYSAAKDQYLAITREWKMGDRIDVSFDVPIKIIAGGKSYPDHVAVQRGPQVLSLDSSLNKSNDFFFNAANISNPGSLQLQMRSGTLPADWVGKQVYSVTLPAANGRTKTALLVPFADASQTGAKAMVWIPVAKKE